MEKAGFQMFSMNETRVMDSNLSDFSSNRQTVGGAEDVVFKAFKLIFYCAVFLIGVTGNVLVFRIVIGKQRLQTVGNIFICNLAAADIAIVTINLPFRLAYQENGYVWPFGLFLCKVIPSLTYAFINASSATLVCMCFDQHRAIVQPLKARLSFKQTKLLILLIWVAALILILPFNFVLELNYVKNKLKCTDNWPSVEFERAYFVILFFVQFVIPMSIISTKYTRICLHLQRMERNTVLHSSQNQRRHRNKKVIRMLIVMVVVYALCTLPWHVTWLLSVYGYSNSMAKKICVLLVISLSATHPIIYGALNKDFGSGFRKYTHCAGRKPTANNGKNFFTKRQQRLATRRRSVKRELLHDCRESSYGDIFSKECLELETAL